MCHETDVSSPSYAFSVLDGAEDNGAGQRVKEHEQEHAEYDEEAFADGHSNCEHQHLECGVFAGDGEESEYHNHKSDHVGQIVLKVTVESLRRKYHGFCAGGRDGQG